MLFNKRLLLLSIGLMVVLLMYTGCGNKTQYGKYNEEQMSQIGLANKYDLPAPSGDSMVLGVHSETITSEEILLIARKTLEPAAGRMDKAGFVKQAQPYVRDLVRGKITDILLYEEARKTAPDTIDDMLDKAVESEVNRFVASYGNDYALAESKVKEMGMDWRSFKEFQRKMIMTQSYLSSTLKDEKRFSQQELKDFYEKNRDAMFCQEGKMSFSLIDIIPDQLTSEQIKGDETPQDAAKRIAQEVLQQLKEGADFSELAKQYHGSLAAIGGKVLEFEPGTNALPEPYNSLEAYALEMKPQQISEPIEIDGNLFILKLETLQIAGCKSFEEAQPLIEQRLLLQSQQQQYNELLRKLVKNTDLAEMDRFTEFCVNQAYKRWGQS